MWSIDIKTVLLILVLGVALSVTFLSAGIHEPFDGVPPIDMSKLTMQALDAPPSTSELKNHYKTLLIFVDDDLRKNGKNGALRILADFRNRVYGRCNFRSDLKNDDVLGNWPDWLPPLNPSIKEPVPTIDDAVTAESKMLAYLARNYPQEPSNDESAAIVRSLLQDFGYRFVFKKGKETERVAPDFAPRNLLKDWLNPVGTAERSSSNSREYEERCIKSE